MASYVSEAALSSFDNIVPSIFRYALQLLIIFFVFRRLHQYQRLRRFKGPFSSGISWLWHSRAVISGEAHVHYGYVTKRYGPIARIAPNHLITSSPELWARVNAVRSPYKRAEWYYHAARFEGGIDNVFTECNNEKHDARRKKMASGYSGKENPTLEPTIDYHIKELIQLIRSNHAGPADSETTSVPMDMATKIQYLTLDIVSAVALSSAFGDLKANDDVNDYLKASKQGLYINNLSFGLGLSWLREVPILGKAIGPSEKDKRGFGKMMAEARKMIEQRKTSEDQGRSDMLASFMRHGLDGGDLFQEVFETVLAGSDTTAAALRITMLYLMTHPRVYAKLQAEIDAAVKSHGLPRVPDIVCDSDVRRLPYLAAVVRESLRIHPPVTNLFSRVVPKNGDVVTVEGKEYFLPGGTFIGYSAWGMHRTNKEVYGEDASVFRPERWLVDDKDQIANDRLTRMQKTNDLIFNHGKWQCLGKNVALIEIHKTIFELLRNFDFSIVDPQRPWTKSETMGLFAIGDMWVHVTERVAGLG